MYVLTTLFLIYFMMLMHQDFLALMLLDAMEKCMIFLNVGYTVAVYFLLASRKTGLMLK